MGSGFEIEEGIAINPLSKSSSILEINRKTNLNLEILLEAKKLFLLSSPVLEVKKNK